MKKRRPIDIIEEKASENPHVEYAFTKKSGEELNIPLQYSRKNTVIPFLNKEEEKVSFLHTHPYNNKNAKEKIQRIILPGPNDVVMFLNKKNKHNYIAQYNSNTKKIEGYLAISKTKKTSKLNKTEYKNLLGIINRNFNKKIKEKTLLSTKYKYKKEKNLVNDLIKYCLGIKEPKNARSAFDSAMKQFGLKYKFLPTKGYELNKFKTAFVKKKYIGNLENKIASLMMITGFIFSLIFSSHILTGQTILNSSNKINSSLGIIFIIITLIAGLFVIKKRLINKK